MSTRRNPAPANRYIKRSATGRLEVSFTSHLRPTPSPHRLNTRGRNVAGTAIEISRALWHAHRDIKQPGSVGPSGSTSRRLAPEHSVSALKGMNLWISSLAPVSVPDVGA